MEPPKNIKIVSEQEFYNTTSVANTGQLSTLSKDLFKEYIFLIFCVAALAMVYCIYKYTSL
jgi:hypothetical protein